MTSRLWVKSFVTKLPMNKGRDTYDLKYVKSDMDDRWFNRIKWGGGGRGARKVSPKMSYTYFEWNRLNLLNYSVFTYPGSSKPDSVSEFFLPNFSCRIFFCLESLFLLKHSQNRSNVN